MSERTLRVERRAAQPVACVHGPAPQRLVDQIGKGIREVLAYLERHGIEPAGPPYARTTWEPGTDLEIGFPVREAIPGEGRVIAGELPAGRVAVARHVGPRERLADTASELRAWIAAQGLREAGVPWEWILTNPAEVPDPEKWENELVYPVEPSRSGG